MPDELKARTDTKGEASLRGHLKADGDEQTGSQSYVPPDAKDDKALKMALDLLRGTVDQLGLPAEPASAPRRRTERPTSVGIDRRGGLRAAPFCFGDRSGSRAPRCEETSVLDSPRMIREGSRCGG